MHDFPGDDLLTPHQRPHGLPIGNLTSQIWANAIMTPVDHLIGSHLGVGTFVRYCDDMLVYAVSRERLMHVWQAVQRRCDALRLRLHPCKCRLHRTSEPIAFLGFVLERVGDCVRVRLRGHNLRHRRKRMQATLACYRHGQIVLEDVLVPLRAWLAHAAHGQTKALCHAELQRLCL